MLPSLEEVLKYSNEQVIARFVQSTGKSVAQAEVLLREVLKFMWLFQKEKTEKAGVKVVMYEEMDDIDEMWHNFILFTPDYIRFCTDYFGEYVQHQPAFLVLSTEQIRGKMQDVAQLGPNAETDEDFAQFYKYVYDNLGPDTVNLWLKTPADELKKIASFEGKLSEKERRKKAFELSYRRFFHEPVAKDLICLYE